MSGALLRRKGPCGVPQAPLSNSAAQSFLANTPYPYIGATAVALSFVNTAPSTNYVAQSLDATTFSVGCAESNVTLCFEGTLYADMRSGDYFTLSPSLQLTQAGATGSILPSPVQVPKQSVTTWGESATGTVRLIAFPITLYAPVVLPVGAYTVSVQVQAASTPGLRKFYLDGVMYESYVRTYAP